MWHPHHILALVALTAPLTAAQDALRRQVIAAFVFTTYGDRTPLVLPENPVLTPLGAQQMHEAGSHLRNQYLTATNADGLPDIYSNIRRMSSNQIPENEITILSRDEQHISAGAMAYMQGLYPPLAAQGSSNGTIIPGKSYLSNRTNVVAPLQGYQYPRIQAVSEGDLNHIYVDGSANCPYYTKSGASYYTSPIFKTIQKETEKFYQSLRPDFLTGHFTQNQVGYFDAYYIYDFLQYQALHNRTAADTLDSADLVRAKILATNWVMAMNANTSSSGLNANDQVGVISGKTLATKVLQAFTSTIKSEGETDKLTLLFGSFEPIIAFSALAALNDAQHSAFLNLPPPGSSITFELFSLRASDIGTYPKSEDLYVRFLYRNGTGPYATAVPYSLFNRSPSQSIMTLSDFTTSMKRISIPSVADWCSTCDSVSIFCPAFQDSLGSSGSSSSRNNSGSKLSPAISGLIGALVALLIAALIFAICFLLLGCRMHRVERGRRSQLRLSGGFKGAKKLASDQDLTLPKKNDGGAEVVVQETDEPMSPVAAAVPGRGFNERGHERVGSWELREQVKREEALAAAMQTPQKNVPRRPSYDDDDDDVINVSPYGRGVRPDERV